MNERIQNIIRELRSMQNAAQVVLDSGFGTHEGEHDTIYRKRRDLAKEAADLLESFQSDSYREATQVTGYCPICAERAQHEQQEPEPLTGAVRIGQVVTG